MTFLFKNLKDAQVPSIKHPLYYVDGEAVPFDLTKAGEIVETKLSPTEKDKQRILKELAFLVDSIELDSDIFTASPEEVYTLAVCDYLKDDHSIEDLENCEDDLEIFNYVGKINYAEEKEYDCK